MPQKGRAEFTFPRGVVSKHIYNLNFPARFNKDGGASLKRRRPQGFRHCCSLKNRAEPATGMVIW
jgi:hypothetical protein